MEFPNRKACIEHYQGQYPNLPRYMIEMALDYDLQNGASSNEKPPTGKEKRKQKQIKKQQQPIKRDLTEQIQDAVKTGKRLEIDCAKVLKSDEYTMPPFIEGHIEVDGAKLEEIEFEEALKDSDF